jgi:hypothetical protein
MSLVLGTGSITSPIKTSQKICELGYSEVNVSSSLRNEDGVLRRCQVAIPNFGMCFANLACLADPSDAVFGLLLKSACGVGCFGWPALLR